MRTFHWSILAATLGIGAAVLTTDSPARAGGGTGFHFHLKSDAQFCMDARGDSGKTGTEVWLWKCNETDAQRWAILNMEKGEGWHPIVGPGGQCLDARGAGKTSGTAMQLYPCHFGANQLFKFHNGTIIEKDTGKCLGVSKTDEKERIRLETCTGAWNREWLFEYNRR